MKSGMKRVGALAGAVACAVFGMATSAHSQQYPSKIVRVIVPFAPGGGSDITARSFSQKLSEYLGQQFIVDNRGGAGGLIGMELTAKAPPDGYTIMMMSASFSATSALRKPAFDPINAIVPVAEFGFTPFVLTVHPSLPAKTTKELIALSRTTKGGLSYAGTGTGGATHLATELFSSMAKIKMVAIQYKSTGAAMADLLSGQVPVIIGSLLPVTPHISAGRLRALAVTTAKRWHTLPNVPTLAETVPGYEVVLWFGTMAPRGTPQPIVDQLNAAINKALQDPGIKKSLESDGMTPSGGTPQHFGERIRADYERYTRVVKESNIKVE
ncbi:MAG TPA: tripartite tricarboxylate transporter substrate binding protein [Burkholderiales bacterium]|jgi:tripartite-type tricarboxylate transporter receptor subunit TctC|nr:tripartite tricarboxylate transporter substrate binding protein [Burkholderiales bacterium]